MVVGDGSSSPDLLEEPEKCRFIFGKHRPHMNGKDTRWAPTSYNWSYNSINGLING